MANPKRPLEKLTTATETVVVDRTDTDPKCFCSLCKRLRVAGAGDEKIQKELCKEYGWTKADIMRNGRNGWTKTL